MQKRTIPKRGGTVWGGPIARVFTEQSAFIRSVKLAQTELVEEAAYSKNDFEPRRLCVIYTPTSVGYRSIEEEAEYNT